MKIALLGDLAFLGRFSIADNLGVMDLLGSLASHLRAYDIVIANLETPLCAGINSKGFKSAHISADPKNINILRYLGITHVSLANNHMGDFGKSGFIQTRTILEDAGIGWFGASNKQVRISQGNERVALLGYCAYNTNPLLTSRSIPEGVHPLEVDSVISDMDKNHKAGYLNIVAVHSGQEHVPMPSIEDISFARGLAKRFSYIYYGHHPHVIQGVEKIDDSEIFYSLGNTLFDDVYTPRNINKPLISLSEANKTGLIADIEIENGVIKSRKVVPVYLDVDQVQVGKEVEGFDMTEINAHIENVDPHSYTAKRNKLISDYLYSRRARRDLNWYFRRLNISSVGILLNARLNSWKQRKYFDEYLSQLE